MNLTDYGHIIIAACYYAVFCGLLVVARTAWKRGGLMRLSHPLVWVGAAVFFFGCGSHHLDFMYHHINDEPIDYDSFHHNAFIVMQVVGAIPFVAVSWSFWKRLRALDLSRRR